MDFSAWSRSHTLLLVITFLAFGGQLVAILTCLKTTAKQHSLEIQKLAEQMQRQEDRLDKRFTEVHQRISDVRDELRAEIYSVRDELKGEIRDVRGEIADVRTELSKMSQNHIDHLSHHEG